MRPALKTLEHSGLDLDLVPPYNLQIQCNVGVFFLNVFLILFLYTRIDIHDRDMVYAISLLKKLFFGSPL